VFADWLADPGARQLYPTHERPSARLIGAILVRVDTVRQIEEAGDLGDQGTPLVRMHLATDLVGDSTGCPQQER
jgi:hypothetical protein